jgi:plasmid stabilization system protein ParE
VTIRWSPEARGDIDRLADFVAAYNPLRASEIEQELSQAPKKLREFPRRASRLSEFGKREIRELRVGNYLLRYEVKGADIVVLRFFHLRENRF